MASSKAGANDRSAAATGAATSTASSEETTKNKSKQLQRVNPSRIQREQEQENDGASPSSCSPSGRSGKKKDRRASLERQPSMYHPEEFANRELPLEYKPKVIKKCSDNAYIFHCVTKGNSGCKFQKNMIVLVHNDKEEEGYYLSVVNPLRLTKEGETHLKQLAGGGGEIKIRNLIRLAPSEHAAFEDEYYLKHYPPNLIQRWAPGTFSSCPHLPVHQTLYDTTNTRQLKIDDPIAPLSPHPDLDVFVFEETVQPEAILYLRHKRTLIAGDCLQAQQDNPWINELGVQHLKKNQLLSQNNPIVISPLWLKLQCVVSNHSRKLKNSFKSQSAQRNKAFFTSSGKFKLRNDFQRLLQMDGGNLKRFISTSGNHPLQLSSGGGGRRRSSTQSMDNGSERDAIVGDGDGGNGGSASQCKYSSLKECITAAVEQACQLV